MRAALPFLAMPVGIVLAIPCLAQTITFESIPGMTGVAPEGLPIRDQFNVAPYFVRFERIHPVLGVQPATLAEVGSPETAFVGPAHLGCDGTRSNDDKPNRGVLYDVGCYFLTDDGQNGRNTTIQPIVVRYTVPVLQASGYILDIDNSERFVVHARDQNDVDITAPIVLDPTGENGDASKWAFDLDEPVFSIRIEGTGGTKGIAFDEFSPSTICPGQVVQLMGHSLAGSAGRVPALSISCPRVNQPGSIEVFNGLAGAHGCLGVSLDPTTKPMCGGAFLANPAYAFAHMLSGDGRFTHNYAPLSMTLINTKFYVQAGYCDPGAACGGISLTEIVEATIR